jgi:uncharacterized protein (DUF58 family)
MEGNTKISELVKKVKRIELKTKRQSMDLLGGQYKSAFKGRGMSFSEVRKYQYGDDIRCIDWNLTAKTGQPHIKIFEEDRELTLVLLLDVSGSMHFGGKKSLKVDRLAELTALLAFSAIQNNDKVGLIAFDSEIRDFLPPKKGRGQVFHIIRKVLMQQSRGGKTSIDQALQYLMKVIKKRSIVFLISDFISEEYAKSLTLAAGKHDLIAIQLIEDFEKEIPNLGLLPVRDPETGQSGWLDTSSRQSRVEINEFFKRESKKAASLLGKAGAAYLPMNSSDNYTSLLHGFFKSRAK